MSKYYEFDQDPYYEDPYGEEEEPYDPLYRGESIVNQGKIKIKASYRFGRFFGRIFIFLMNLIILFALIVGMLYLTSPRARVNGKLVNVKKSDIEYSVGDKVIVAKDPKFYDTFLYLFDKKQASLFEIVGLPYSLQKVNGKLVDLEADEYFLTCIDGCQKGSEGIVADENIVGILRVFDEDNPDVGLKLNVKLDKLFGIKTETEEKESGEKSDDDFDFENFFEDEEEPTEETLNEKENPEEDHNEEQPEKEGFSNQGYSDREND